MVQPLLRLFLARLGAGTLVAACLLTGLTVAGCSNHSASAQSSQADSSSPGSGGSGAGAPGAGPRGNRQFAQVLEGLGLSDDQKDQIRKLMADARTQARTQTDPQQKRATMRAAFQKLQDILTPAQRDAFKTKMQALRASRQGTQQ